MYIITFYRNQREEKFYFVSKIYLAPIRERTCQDYYYVKHICKSDEK